MADEDTEEKQFEATPQKLKKAREKGQTAASTDLVNAITFLIVIIAAYAAIPLFVSLVGSLLQVGAEPPNPARIGEKMTRDLAMLGWGLFFPLFGIILLASAAIVLTHIVHKGGLIVSVHPITPDFSRLSPGTGFKNMFAKGRTWTELGVSLARCLIWFGACAILVYFFLPVLMNAPLCGLNCTLTVGSSALTWLIVLTCLALAVIGLLDLPLQFFLFRKEMRMSKTEMKKDLQETEGSPEMRRHRHEIRMAASRTRGLAGSSFVVASSDAAIALFYDPVEAPVPVIVAKGRGASADRIFEIAKKFNIHIETAPDLAERLYAKSSVDGYAPESEFNPLALIIVRLRNPGAG